LSLSTICEWNCLESCILFYFFILSQLFLNVIILWFSNTCMPTSNGDNRFQIVIRLFIWILSFGVSIWNSFFYSFIDIPYTHIHDPLIFQAKYMAHIYMTTDISSLVHGTHIHDHWYSLLSTWHTYTWPLIFFAKYMDGTLIKSDWIKLVS
jgi:hypothetical protein